ncbi:MAG: hypothetical protein NTY39_08215 [Campylobacterales bacterium]|nr:hypothetical protein [Campylobacterales bacterium]
MNTLKAKIIIFFLLTTLLIFTTLVILILKMEKEDKIKDTTALLHHISSEIITDNLVDFTPDPNLKYLQQIELIRTLYANKELSAPHFKIISNPKISKIHPNTITVMTKLSNGAYFVATSDTKIIEKSLHRLAMTLYLLFFGALALLTFIFYTILQKLLDPMEQLARACITIDLEENSTHLPLSSASVEIQRVGQALQTLVDKITFLREKERQLFKETAHQFKTPLAILKARLDSYALNPTANKEQFLRQANGDIGKLLKYLKELLIVQESQISDKENSILIDMESLIANASTYATPLLQRKHQSVDLQRGNSFTLTTHSQSFTKLILTILENCINHAPENATITISLYPKEGEIVFANPITSDKSPALFNSNLGLTIIRRLSSALNLQLSVKQHDNIFLLSINCTPQTSPKAQIP